MKHEKCLFCGSAQHPQLHLTRLQDAIDKIRYWQKMERSAFHILTNIVGLKAAYALRYSLK